MENHGLKLLVVGLDGVNLDLIGRLLPKSSMPTLNSLIKKGLSGPLRSVFPTHSAAAWSSFMTGSNPSSHGVFDFKVRLADGRYRHAKPLADQTLWRIVGNHGYRVGVFNFPVTFPPDALNGWLVSGMLSSNLERATYPSSIGIELRQNFPDYKFDVEWMLYENRPKDLITDLTAMVQQRIKVAHFLLAKNPVDCFFIAFIATDRAQHALWRYMDPLHPNYNVQEADRLAPLLHEFYLTLDHAIDELLSYCDENTVTILLSDHGFQSAAWQFHVNGWLAEHRWLYYQERSERLARWIRKVEPPNLRLFRRKLLPDISRHFSSFAPGGTIDWTKTMAFCPWNFHQGIRFNRKHLEMNKIIVNSDKFDRLLNEVSEALMKTRNPINGERVVKNVYRVADIYQGKYLDQMPDLVFELQQNYAPGTHKQQHLEPTDWVSGDHNLDGFFTFNLRHISGEVIQTANLIDIAPTILTLLGVPIPDFIQGRSLIQGIKIPTVSNHTQKLIVSPHQPQSAGNELSEEEEKRLLEQLKNLGYL